MEAVEAAVGRTPPVGVEVGKGFATPASCTSKSCGGGRDVASAVTRSGASASGYWPLYAGARSQVACSSAPLRTGRLAPNSL